MSQEVIREAVQELLLIDGAAGISFHLDVRTQISVGNLEENRNSLRHPEALRRFR